MKCKRLLAFLLVFTSIFFCVAIASASGNVPQKVLDLRKSVVRIVCQTPEGAYTGSGFAIGQDIPVKYIVTNLHVVSPNTNGVSILRENNGQAKAKVYLQIPNADLCVLLLDEPLYNVPPVQLRDQKEADVGQAVYALGFPGAADYLSDTMTGNPQDVTITDGIVSAAKALTLVKDGKPIRLLQINAAINHGNSGGPLVNVDAQVLGINSLGATDAQNINGAISILELTSALKSNGIAYISAGTADTPRFPYWIVIAASVLIAAGAVLFIVLRHQKKAVMKDEKAVLLPEYLRSWGGRIPYDAAAHVMEGMVRELALLHATGRCHGDVCPETVRIEGNRAYLQAPENGVGGKVVLRPGFSAPEQYRADGRIGPWSDVYSVCAVLNYTVTGIRPLGVLECQAHAGGDIGFGDANIDETHQKALLAGMAPDAAVRPQNCLELIRALGMPEVAAPSPENAPAAESPIAEREKLRARKKWSVEKRALTIGVCVLGALCLGAGGFWFYNDSMYNQAVACIGKQDYAKGVDDLKQVLSIYKSSSKYMTYACAGSALRGNQFDNAKNDFKSLGDFNGADKMLTEVDYQQALFLLAQGNFDQSKVLFTSLESYKDSAQMILETDYQRALSQMQGGQFQKAIEGFTALAKSSYKDSAAMVMEAKYESAVYLSGNGDANSAFMIFKGLGAYKDSAAYMQALAQSLYDQAVTDYRQKKYTEAGNLFSAIGSYARSDDYQALINARTITDAFIKSGGHLSSSDYSKVDDAYQRLLSIGPLEDSTDLFKSELYLLFRLQGHWQCKKDIMSFTYNASQSCWEFAGSDVTIPLNNIYMKNNILYVSNFELFSVVFLTDNRIIYKVLSWTFTYDRISY